MKNAILILSMLVFFVPFSMAVDFQNNKNLLIDKEQQITKSDDGFQEIQLREVPNAVRDSVDKKYTGALIESAERKTLPDGKQVFRLTLNLLDQEYAIRSFYSDGSKYEEK